MFFLIIAVMALFLGSSMISIAKLGIDGEGRILKFFPLAVVGTLLVLLPFIAILQYAIRVLGFVN